MRTDEIIFSQPSAGRQLAVETGTAISPPLRGKLAFYCCNTGECWTPDAVSIGGSGGAEETVLWLSQLLCRRGWKVEVYSGCVNEEKRYGEVVWKPLAAWNVDDPRDVVFLW